MTDKLDMNVYVKATFILLFIDLLWVNLIMKKKYNNMIHDIQKSKMNIRSQFVFLSYFFMILGLNIFVLPNVRDNYLLRDSFFYGFLFGVILYGVYDFTIAAVLTKWEIKTAIIDVLWGGFVFFLATYLAFKI